MWWWPAQTALCSGVIPSSLGLLGSSTWDTGCVSHACACGAPRQGLRWAHLIDDPLHQVELSLQGRVQEQRQGVEADAQPAAGALGVGLLQVGPLAL